MLAKGSIYFVLLLGGLLLWILLARPPKPNEVLPSLMVVQEKPQPSNRSIPGKLPNGDIQGIDVSNYQGQIKFNEVKNTGLAFVFIKASQGDTYQDPLFKTNFKAAKQAGLIVGAYHYYMTDDEPKAQFENFSKIALLGKGDLPPVVDIETAARNSLPDLNQQLQKFLNLLEKHYGVKPIIYSGLYFANQHLQDLGQYPLWLAEYGVNKPTLPKTWNTWHFWQWSQNAKVDGIQGYVDANRYNGDKKTFLDLLIQ